MPHQLKQFKFIRVETHFVGFKKVNKYICHNGEREVVKDYQDIKKLFAQGRLDDLPTEILHWL